MRLTCWEPAILPAGAAGAAPRAAGRLARRTRAPAPSAGIIEEQQVLIKSLRILRLIMQDGRVLGTMTLDARRAIGI